MLDYISISNVNDERIKIYLETSENRLARIYEPQPGLFIAESFKVISRAMDAGYYPESMVLNLDCVPKEEMAALELWFGGVEANADSDVADVVGANAALDVAGRLAGVPVYSLDNPEFGKIRGFSITDGIMAAMRRRTLPTVEETLRDAKSIVVLEDVENPTNVGAIFRSAAALGMDAVILTKGSADPLYRRSVRVSMGTVFQVPWTFISGDYLCKLKELGFNTAAMALRNNSYAITDSEIKSCEKLAVILGNEAEGLKQSTIDASDYTVMIPMSHGVDSLNVSNAAAIAFWEVGKR